MALSLTLFARRYDNSDMFRQDASFKIRNALNNDGNCVSFESVNYPGHYICHRDFRLLIATPGGGGKEASFSRMACVAGEAGESDTRELEGIVRLRSSNYPGHLWNADDKQNVCISSRGEGTAFRVVRGLKDNSGVSLESLDEPGHYLRHSSYMLRLGRNDGRDLFLKDATFFVEQALDGSGGVSLVSYNFPNYYISHRSYKLKIAIATDSTLHRKDASFNIELG